MRTFARANQDNVLRHEKIAGHGLCIHGGSFVRNDCFNEKGRLKTQVFSDGLDESYRRSVFFFFAGRFAFRENEPHVQAVGFDIFGDDFTVVLFDNVFGQSQA